MVFAENGDMGDDIHGRDVGGDDNDCGRVVDIGIVSGALRLAESLDDFLNTTAKSLGLCSCNVSVGVIDLQVRKLVDIVNVHFLTVFKIFLTSLSLSARGKAKGTSAPEGSSPSAPAPLSISIMDTSGSSIAASRASVTSLFFLSFFSFLGLETPSASARFSFFSFLSFFSRFSLISLAIADLCDNFYCCNRTGMICGGAIESERQRGCELVLCCTRKRSESSRELFALTHNHLSAPSLHTAFTQQSAVLELEKHHKVCTVKHMSQKSSFIH